MPLTSLLPDDAQVRENVTLSALGRLGQSGLGRSDTVAGAPYSYRRVIVGDPDPL